MSKIGQSGPPQVQQSQAPSVISTTQQSQARVQENATNVQSFEPNQTVLAEQPLLQSQSNQKAPRGTIKAGLLSRNSFNVGQFLNKAKQSLDKLDQQINWRSGRMLGQLSDFFKPRSADQRPPIQAMYGVIMPGVIDGNPGQIGNELPPIQAMYGVIMPPEGWTPVIQPKYGVIRPPMTQVDTVKTQQNQ